MIHAITAALMLSLSGVISQPENVSGIWHVTMPADSARRADGSNASWGELTGTLVLTQTRRDITGTWTVKDARDAWKVTGRLDEAGRLILETEERVLSVVIDGKQSAPKFRWRFRGSLGGGTLSGTAALERANSDRELFWRNWTASRSTRDSPPAPAEAQVPQGAQ
jgi:hypothetical protein